ncbi:glycosyltransferase family 59 protein [Glonium stellatum]|uniref:Dol-P-Glc:Glc(2)Man(9)GlcNAc(2)-PP-Dol alpha-1,2-glucosyltransferase n=1 Tax=Glonium stellatum TaxID=574774 RepID=A0A8E2ES48_9PEZI|nr:glycosyltransferase family 59 protein [Glonium stellatum]
MRELHSRGRQFTVLSIAILLVTIISAVWLQSVSRTVPEPYLDEVFHVRQAQVYCAGAFHQWDPKITTPPGLYLISYVVFWLTGRCDIYAIRALNVFGVCLIVWESFDILLALRRANRSKTNEEDKSQEDSWQLTLLDAHKAVNIGLFPPLFFFSALYYTDVVSTWYVLKGYKHFLQSQQPNSSLLGPGVRTVFIGIAALFFRQTNIFWVAIFPAGLAVINALRNDQDRQHPTKVQDLSKIINESWQNSVLYDCPVENAGLEDCFAVVISAALVALCKPLVVLRAVAPYIILLFAFGSFVAWNGGVVLGDKSNHVATLHFPQMLYIWPYIMFFSWPLALPSFFRSLDQLPRGAFRSFSKSSVLEYPTWNPPRPLSIAAFAVLGTGAVHYNTIVHPFTLADNRHYVFYVFRILLRHPAIKYFAVLAYCCCGWAAVQILGSLPSPGRWNQTAGIKGNRNGKKKSQASTDTHDDSCPVSFIIVWLAATALSVVTAPLVEPRYFIVPWIMWRLHVPSSSASPFPTDTTRDEPLDSPNVWERVWRRYDFRLWIETIWLLVANVITGYMFLHRGFAWPQEPGKVQRFMW